MWPQSCAPSQSEHFNVSFCSIFAVWAAGPALGDRLAHPRCIVREGDFVGSGREDLRGSRGGLRFCREYPR